ncbi:MAG TPA: DMT family transporter [Bradyrhizobium sp.]|nr:DMT family transporter [Bradyrhizobium sp.]
MPLFSLALIVLAAFIHATWNLLSKRAAAAGAAFVFAYSLAGCVIYLPWVIWVLTHHEQSWSLWTICCCLLSGAIHLAYSLCLQRGYQVADLSVVYPVARGTGPMLSSLGALVLLREAPTTHGLLGLLAVVTGIGLISTQGDLSAFRRPAGHAGIRWGLATGSLIASYTVVDGYGVKALGIQPVVLDWLSNFLRVLLLIPVVLSNRERVLKSMKGRWSLAIWVGALSPLSYILVLTALDWGAPLSLVAPAREMSMMVGAIFGMVLLGERVSTWRTVGCLTLVLGVVLLGIH